MQRGFAVGLVLAIGQILSPEGMALANGPGGCGNCGHCNNKCCPPPFLWCTEGPPRIKFKCACPRPVCDPCSLEHYGYYPTCWRPWEFPPDWSHCPVPPPAAMLPAPPYPPYSPRVPYQPPHSQERPRESDLPTPRPMTYHQPTVRLYQ